MGLDALLHKKVGVDGQRIVAVEGRVDAEAAWKIVKRLEGLGREEFPLVLDLSRVQSIHWFAIEILKKGVESLNRKTGPIYLKFGLGITELYRQP